MLVLPLTLWLFIEFSKTFCLTTTLFHVNLVPGSKKRLGVITVVFIASTIVLSMLNIDLSSMSFITGFLSVAAMLALLQKKRNILFVLVSFVGISLIDSLIASAIYGVAGYNPATFLHRVWINLGVNSISFVPILIGSIVLAHRNATRKPLVLGYQRLLWPILIGLCAVNVYIMPIQMISLDASSSFATIGIIGITASTLLFIFIAVYALLSANRKEQAQKKNQLYASLLRQQKEYYTALIGQDKEMRKYRHDINAHLNYLDELLQSDRRPEAQAYVSELVQRKDKITTSIDTGNSVMNIIVSQLMPAINEIPDVEFVWAGACPDEIGISDVDTCILLSNLLRNAANAVTKCTGKKYIHVNIAWLGENIHLYMENSTAELVPLVKGRPQHNTFLYSPHGYGLQNVEDVVTKYDGSIDYVAEETFFAVDIVMQTKAPLAAKGAYTKNTSG